MVEEIKSLCSKKGISISALEREIGLGKNSIAKWDDSRPSIDKVQAVASYFGMTVSELIGEEQKNPATVSGDGKSEAILEVISLLTSLPPDKVLQARDRLKEILKNP